MIIFYLNLCYILFDSFFDLRFSTENPCVRATRDASVDVIMGRDNSLKSA